MYRLRNLKFEIRWAWQRLVRGWDDTIYFDPDTYLADYIQRACDMKLKDEDGYLSYQEHKDLQQLSFGMGSYLEMSTGIYKYGEAEYKRLEKEYKKGLQLLVEYFGKLWY